MKQPFPASISRRRLDSNSRMTMKTRLKSEFESRASDSNEEVTNYGLVSLKLQNMLYMEFASVRNKMAAPRHL